MAIETIKAERKDSSGSAEARRLRRRGLVPGVLYGHGEGTVGMALSCADLQKFLDTGHHIITLDLAGEQERALVKDVQYDPWGNELLHVDFTRVSLHEKVTVSVSVISHGTPKTVLTGGILEHPLTQIEVECESDKIPDEIRVEVGHLEPKEMIHVRDVELPDGVTAVTDPDAIVFVVHEARRIEEEAPAEEVAEEAQPEVIGRAAKPEGEDADKGKAD